MEGAVVSASMGVIGPLLAEITILCARLPAGRPKTEMEFFEEKLRSIQEMVSSLHAVKMSHMVEEDTLLKKRWAKQAREIAYDTQDLVDLFRHGAGLSLSDETAPAGVMPKTAGRLKKLRTFSSRPKKPRLDREMVNKVEELKARMAEVIERHKRFKISMESSSPPKEDMPSCSGHQIQIQIQSEARSPAVSIDAYFSALYAGGDGLVGIDGPREELTALLMDENQHMKVISVLGPEGIGKSTLTKEVFNNIQGKFECCAFVSMSQKTGIQEILQAFLSQFSAQDQDGASIEACQEERLTHKLIQLLKSKRYFVVLDGVSSTRAWRLIRCALPGNNLGSRILMTTCIDDIAKSCCSTTADSIYRMKYLPEVERRRLFMDRTFGLEKRCPYRLEEVGSEILRKCGGWPIVILTIASLLASKSSSEEQWKMIQGSIGLALECPRKKKGLALEQSQVRSCDSLQGVKNILYFCYNDLPQHLKTCLLYLSIYPEGYVISRDRLVRRWIAEGFISVRSEHENLEEVGQCYFNELINRGMIQPVGIQYDGRADACQVHNLILSLIVSICAEENFVTLFDGQAHELGTTDKVRRLSLNYHGQKHFALPSTITASPIRSLTLFGSAQGAPILSNNRVLRVLDLDVQGDPGKKYLGTVGSFFQLKYLGLQMSGVVDLPEQIGELQFLETLDLTKSSIRKLPRSILRLWRLVYLLACNVELPDGVGDMQSLEELSGIQVNTTNSTNSLLGVGQLTKLRIVQLIWSISDVCGDIKGYEDNLLSSLKELSKLQSLSIESKDGSSLNFLDSWSPHPQSLQKLYLSGGYYFPRIPERIISLVKLDFLDIRVYQVEDEIMNVLGSLPALLVLSLSSQVAAPEQRIVVQPGLFHCLTKFTLTCLNSWTGLVTEPEALPKLARLGLLCYVQGQRDPVCGDYGIKYLCSLKNLHVEITLGGAGIWEVATRSPESPPPQVQISDEHHMVEEAEIIEVVESLSTHIEAESTIYKDAKMLPKPPTYDFKSWDPQHIVGVHVEMDSQSSQEGPEEVQGIRDVRRWKDAIDVVRKANLQRDDPLNLAEKVVRNLENATKDLNAKGNDVRREIVDDETLLERILSGDEDPKDLPLALLQSITNDFSQDKQIGQGGFGAVYKGELQNGIIVAVKRIEVNQNTIDDVSFRREFNLMNMDHRNVVRFLGFCSNTHHIPRKEAGQINLVNVRERLLCFEYIRNGSLDKHITDELRGLEWESRYAIISGICKGLFYLHEEKKIVHMDLKPPNILLDDHMVPKITDFGLSRSNEMSHTTGQRFGTPGYVAPEYRKDGKTSFKCDIYSLGVIITELVTGRKSVPHKNNVLRRWRHRWNKPPTLLQYRQITRCIEISVRCRQQESGHRPSILEIINILGESESMDEHTGQESAYLDDDMLRIEPLELKLNEEMSWSVKLTNKTTASFAFNIERPSQQYTIWPDKGIVTPGCNEYFVQITLQPQQRAPQVTQNADKIIFQSTKVPEGLRDEDITENIFHEEAGKVVDEVDLMIVYEPTKPKENCKSREDTNMLAEEVSEAKRREIVESAFGKGKLGSSETAEAHYKRSGLL